MSRPRWLPFLGCVLLGGLSLAPTPGDIGGCGQPPEFLDADAFQGARQELDCRRCGECNIVTERCAAACEARSEEWIPEGCAPLIHDGFVCLRALEHASCGDYSSFVADERPTVPTECNFCPAEAAP